MIWPLGMNRGEVSKFVSLITALPCRSVTSALDAWHRLAVVGAFPVATTPTSSLVSAKLLVLPTFASTKMWELGGIITPFSGPYNTRAAVSNQVLASSLCRFLPLV
jgi:hypothetical protein